MKIIILTSEGIGSSLMISRFLRKIPKNIEVKAIVRSETILNSKGLIKTVKHFLRVSCFEFIFLQGIIMFIYKYFKVLGLFNNNYEIKSLEDLAKKYDIPLVYSNNINSKSTIDAIRKLNPDLLVSIYLNQLVGSEILALPRKGAINVHGALLPYYKGVMPNIWVLANNEKSTGATVHFMTEKFDVGRIVRQTKIPILKKDTPIGLYLKLSSLGADLLSEAVSELQYKNFDFYKRQKDIDSYYSWPQKQEFCKLRKNKRKIFRLNELFKIFKNKNINMSSDFIKVAEPVFDEKEYKYIKECLDSKNIAGKGEIVRRFEKSFANYCGAKYGSSCANGTVAIHLALLALGIGRGDEVLIPDITFVSTLSSVLHAGATPVLVDVEKRSWAIDPQKIKDKIGPNTKAIIVVHLYGQPADMDMILQIARENNLKVIEDAAEAIGAEYKGRHIGALADIGTFSFYGNKTITTGEGGMCVTNNEELYKKIELFKDHYPKEGQKFSYDDIGYNYRINGLGAAIGLAQLEKLDGFVARKQEIANFYTEQLRAFKNIEFMPNNEWSKNCYWMYSILLKDEEQRDGLAKYLGEKNIETREFFGAFHLIPIFQRYKKEGDSLEVSDELSKRGLNLPSGAGLTDEETTRVCNSIKDFFTNQNI